MISGPREMTYMNGLSEEQRTFAGKQYRAFQIIDQRTTSGRQFTIFVDSTAAIQRITSDAEGPGQRFAVASIEVCSRIVGRGNGVTVRWVPAHRGAEGNEKADELATSAAESIEPTDRVDGEYR